MSSVRGKGQTPQQGHYTRGQIERMMPAAKPRDDLDKKFAGEENMGPFGDPKESTLRSTHVKSRKPETGHGTTKGEKKKSSTTT